MGDAKQSDEINGLSMESESQSPPETVRLLDLDEQEEETLKTILHRMISAIFSGDSKQSSLFQRIKGTVIENAPLVPEAGRNSANKLLIWTRQGSSLRALLVISVGTIVLVTLTGLLVFMLFFLAATINAIVISLLVSLAAAGGFLALFFGFMTAIYIGALSVAVFVISSATIATIFSVLVATGWIGFFWTVWIATKKGLGLARHSINMTGSAISAYSSSSREAKNIEPDKSE
ncbi:hypothetical protein ACHQM5_005552 [Ranunculus cassubicifolius]